MATSSSTGIAAKMRCTDSARNLECFCGIATPVGRARVLTLERTVAEQRTHGTSVKRSSERLAITVPARITWKDASGAVRFRVGDDARHQRRRRVRGMRSRRGHPALSARAPAGRALARRRTTSCRRSLREGRVLSAVWRVAPCRRSTGTPSGYALRFLVDPQVSGGARLAARRSGAMAVTNNE